MPRLIYGTAWKGNRTADLVVQAIQLGFKGIDTACQPKHYNEAGVGEALCRLAEKGIQRESLFIQTKFTPSVGQDPLTIPYRKSAPFAEQVFQDKNIIYQSFWTLTANPHLLAHPLLRKIAQEFKKTEAQIFFRFLTQIGIVPLIGACSEIHMKQDLDIFNFNLNESMIQEIESLMVDKNA